MKFEVSSGIDGVVWGESKITTSKHAIPLKLHIFNEHEGKNSKFAHSINKHNQQITRYIKAEAIWFNGRVYLPAK